MMFNHNDNYGMVALLRSPTGIFATIAIAYVCHRILFNYQWTFTAVPTKRKFDDIKDREAQMKAREAAEMRHKVWKATQKQKKRATLQSIHISIQGLVPEKNYKDNLNQDQFVRSSDAASTSMSMEEITAA